MTEYFSNSELGTDVPSENGIYLIILI